MKKWVNGEVLDADELNAQFVPGLTSGGLTVIRQLIDRGIVFSSGDIEGWGEAYTSEGGRLSSVVTADTDASFDSDKYKPASTADTPSIVHNIPIGSVKTTIQSAIGVPLIDDWEEGASIQYKISNNTEDTGWLDAYLPQISSFTAFEFVPTKLTVKLIPKSSGAAVDTPSIKGFWFFASD